MVDQPEDISPAAQQRRDLERWKKEWLAWGVTTVVLVAIWTVIYLVSGRLVLWTLPVGIIVIWGLLVALAPFFPARRQQTDGGR